MQQFVGELKMAAARARMAAAETKHDGQAEDAMNQLASALHKSGDFDGALQMFRKVLKETTAQLGPDHTLMTDTKNK